MSHPTAEDALNRCISQWHEKGFVDRGALLDLAHARATGPTTRGDILRVFKAFNDSDLSREAIRKAVGLGDDTAVAVRSLRDLLTVDSPEPYSPSDAREYEQLRAHLSANPAALYGDANLLGYPYYVPGRTYRYDVDWVRATMQRTRAQIAAARLARVSDTAVLVGNGPTLNNTDLNLLAGHDVFISNYAVKHPILSSIAKGVAVTNYLVAEQEPYLFSLSSVPLKFYPFWLRNSISDDESTIFLNASGGELFFSRTVEYDVSWSATVSYFWMQILHSLGYRKVLLIGFDHSYEQRKSAKEGEIIVQHEADPNHFDPNYFKGKRWQAADVSHMGEGYELAKRSYEADDREIVNCTVGGHLEVFRRSDLAYELRGALPARRSSAAPSPRVAVVTPFWEGDQDMAELQWRVLGKLGPTGIDHIHLFKQRHEELRTNTFRTVTCADIAGQFPAQAALPHPAGPNLMFVNAVRMLAKAGYTHFFWLEPDCLPTNRTWLAPFIQIASTFPNEPIVGTGGGTTLSGQLYWKNHFAGCSLYNIAELTKVDWDRYISQQLDVSFDVWLSVELGFIKLAEQNDADLQNTIIFGAHRYNWQLLRRPPSLVPGMFEHWRPEKVMSPESLERVLDSGAFSLHHAIKDRAVVRRTFGRLPRTATTIIINYNNDRYLKEAIESALDQTLTGVDRHQILVVDDGSSDDSRDIILSFGRAIQPLLLRHGKLNGNFNQQRALLHAVRAATGDIVFLLDGDDTFGREKISVVAKQFDDPNVVVVQHTLARINDRGVDSGNDAAFFSKVDIDASVYGRESRTNYFQPTSGLCFRRTYLEYALRWLTLDAFHRTWLDVRLTRFAPIFGKVVNLPQRLGKWRRHDGSASIRTDDVLARMQEHHDWFNFNGSSLGLHVDYAANYPPDRSAGTLPRHRSGDVIEGTLAVSGEGARYLLSDSSTKRFTQLSLGRMAIALPDAAVVRDHDWARVLAFDIVTTGDQLGLLGEKLVRAVGDWAHPAGRLVVLLHNDADRQTVKSWKYHTFFDCTIVVLINVSPGLGTDESITRSCAALGYNVLLEPGSVLGSDSDASEPRFVSAVDPILIAGSPEPTSVHQYWDQRECDRASRPAVPKVAESNGRQGRVSSEGYARAERASVDETGVVARLMRDHGGPQNVMLDVGAHFGTSAAYFDALGWTVHCFEPDPGNREKLAKRYGSKPNITIDPRAVSDRPATSVPFFRSDESTGISGLHAFHGSHREDGRVDVTTVAEIIANRNLEQVDFLKIDVEGYDFSVLRGVPWERIAPDIIECEFEDSKTIPLGHTYRDMADFLVSKGYSVYLSEWHPIIKYGMPHDWRRVLPYSDESLPPDAWGNILAFKKDPGYVTLQRAFEAVMKMSAPAVAQPKPASVSVPRVPERAAPLYQRTANSIRDRYPVVFRGLQPVVHALRAAWRRRRTVGVALLVLAIVGLLGFLPPFAPWSLALWAVASFGTVALAGIMIVRRIQFLNDQVLRENADLKARLVKMQRQVTDTGKLVEKLRAGLATVDRQLLDKREQGPIDNSQALAAQAAAEMAKAFAEQAESAAASTETLARSTEDLARSTEESTTAALSRAEELQGTVETRLQELELAALGNRGGFQSFNRHLTPALALDLSTKWAEPLGLELQPKVLSYMAYRANTIEDRLHGRLATGVENIVLRTVVAMAVKGRSVSILEIGTLFGTGAAIMYDALEDRFDNVHLTLLDPLDGYYGAGQTDILTAQPVSEAALHRNMQRVGADQNVTLIKHLSTEPEAVDAARSRTYDVLIIDGDHSHAGVKADFELYAGMVKPGGFIIFDDYGSPEWPDVKAYVDAEVMDLPHLKFVGHSWRTVVFQVLAGSEA